jgi:hypothetical protein
VVHAKLDPSSPTLTLYERPANATATSKPATPAVLPDIKQGAKGYWEVDFQHLASFTFIPPQSDAPYAPGSQDGIPPNIRALEGKRVRLSGFMLPLVMDNKTGLVKEFLLLRNQMACCYGIVPQPNEWVLVKMKDEGTDVEMDVPYAYYGTLHVGAVYEDKTFASIYSLDCEKCSDN